LVRAPYDADVSSAALDAPSWLGVLPRTGGECFAHGCLVLADGLLGEKNLWSCSPSGPTYDVDETIRDQIAPVASSSDGGSSLERGMARLIRGHQSQKRREFIYDRRLASAARQRAKDMAKRDYFNHVDPDGNGPNYYVTRAGYRLPVSWTAFAKSNNVESILSGPSTAKTATAAFLNSKAHRPHILGGSYFYRQQNHYGIGHYYDPSSRYKHASQFRSWVFVLSIAQIGGLC